MQFKNECFLTFYGCYGYYDFPGKIFVNINATPEFVLETIVHEMIHLMIYEKVSKKSYQETEMLVDKIFVEAGLREIFPNYEIQDF